MDDSPGSLPPPPPRPPTGAISNADSAAGPPPPNRQPPPPSPRETGSPPHDLHDQPHDDPPTAEEHGEKTALAEYSAPQIFLSYRLDDTGDIIEGLTNELRRDIGRSSLFRDKDDNVLGQNWRESLDEALTQSDGVLALIGPRWVGASDDGTLRINHEDDVVRQEVLHALREESKSTPLPVLIDVTAHELTQKLPPDPWASLFENHVLESSRADILNAESIAYQRLLVGMWHSLTTRIDGAVLIIGECATAELAGFIEELKNSKAADARNLSRIGANVYALSVSKLRRKARRWPDVIVLVDSSEGSRRRSSLLAALDQHPSVKKVSVVGLGVAVGAGAGALATGGIGSSTSSTAVTTHAGTAQFASSVSLKLAAAGALAAAAVVTAAAVIWWPDPNLDVEFSNQVLAVAAADERSFPLGQPEQAAVTFGPELETDEVGALGNSAAGHVRRSVIVELPGEEPIDFGEIVLPASLSDAGSERNSDGTFLVASASAIADLSYRGLSPQDFCFEDGNPSRVLAGWEFMGEPSTVEVSLQLTMDDGEVAGTSSLVVLSAPARRVLLEGVGENFDLSLCPELSDGLIQWGGTETE